MHDMYSAARQAFGTAQLNWPVCQPYLILINQGYVGDPNHVYMSEVPLAARVGSPLLLSAVSMDEGIARAGPVELGVVYAGAYVAGGIVFSNAGSDSTSRLIACYQNVLGLPGLIPAGGSIWTWDAVNGLFRV